MEQRENGNEASAVNVTAAGVGAGNAHWTAEDIVRAKAAGLTLDIERTNVIIVTQVPPPPPPPPPPLKFTGIVRDDAVRADLRKNRTTPPPPSTPMKMTTHKPVADPPDVNDLLKTILHWKGEAERLAGEVTKLQARIANLSGNDRPLAPLIGSSDVDVWQRRLDEFRKANPRDNSKARGRGRVISPPMQPVYPVVPAGPADWIIEPDADGCCDLPMAPQEMLNAIQRQLADKETARLAEEHKRKPRV